MDSDVEIMYIPSFKTFISRNNVVVSVDKHYNRRKLPHQYETEIEDTWNKKLGENPTIWNGHKFRIHSVTEAQDVNAPILHLGITCYKEFIGTNWSENAKIYQQLGVKNFNDSHAYFSDALGVGAFVQTDDDCIILLKRSSTCAEAVGLWDIPGGHPEPHEVTDKIDADNLEDLSGAAVVNEIFNSVIKEITSEVNVPEQSLSDPQLMGIARNTTSAGRPSAEFYVRCHLTSEAVVTLYRKGTHSEAEESTDIKMLPLNAVPSLQQQKELWGSMAPSAKGCFTLYQLIS